MSIVSAAPPAVIIADESEDMNVNVPPKSTSESVPAVPANVNESLTNLAFPIEPSINSAVTEAPALTEKSISDESTKLATSNTEAKTLPSKSLT